MEVESEGYGYVVASLGELGGNVPYTSYNARISYIENNPKVIKGFTRAIQKGLDFVNNNTSEVIAESILSFFPDTSLNDLIIIVEEYKTGDAWKEDISITENEWKHIQDIIISAGELDSYAPYQDLIYK